MPAVAHLYPDQAYLTHKAAAMVHAVAIIHEKDSGMLSAAGDLLIDIKTGGLPAELLMLLANSLPHVTAAVLSLVPLVDTPDDGDSGTLRRVERLP